ncbi:hypothetical protein HOP50_18g81040 [Chloropicon primus]|nr:hypothetical protein HOP50_18g81040 [Chloropicon primus]
MEEQRKRREELAGYVNKVQEDARSLLGNHDRGEAGREESLVQTIASMVKTNVKNKRNFLKDLQEYSSRKAGLAEEGEKPWEADEKINTGLDKIKKLDDKLKGVEDKLKILSAELSASGSGSAGEGSSEGTAAVAKHKSNFMKARQLKRVLGPVSERTDLTAHEKRNAAAVALGTDAGRWFTLSEEDEKLVEEVLSRDDDDFENEEDPYQDVFLGTDLLGPEEDQEGGATSSPSPSLSGAAGRMAEIDRKLEEYSQCGSVPPTPKMSLSSLSLPSSSSPDSVISPNSKKQSYVQEAREVRALLRMERDLDAKIAHLRQSELVLVPREEIDMLLLNLYNTSAPAGEEVAVVAS